MAYLSSMAQFSTLQKIHPFKAMFLIFAAMPLIDDNISSDFENPVKDLKKTEGRLAYKLPLYAAIIADWMFMFNVIIYLTYSEVAIINDIQVALLILAGNLALLNINVGHELLHKDDKFTKFVGTYTLLKNLNIHSRASIWASQVTTRLDPASAPKASKNSYTQACSFEKHKPLLDQKTFKYTTQYALMVLFMAYLFGVKGAFYFLVQAVLSIFAIIGADYTEHYGLSRKEISSGTYEQFKAKNSSNTILNYTKNTLIIEKDYPLLPYCFLFDR